MTDKHVAMAQRIVQTGTYSVKKFGTVPLEHIRMQYRSSSFYKTIVLVPDGHRLDIIRDCLYLPSIPRAPCVINVNSVLDTDLVQIKFIQSDVPAITYKNTWGLFSYSIRNATLPFALTITVSQQ